MGQTRRQNDSLEWPTVETEAAADM